MIERKSAYTAACNLFKNYINLITNDGPPEQIAETRNETNEIWCGHRPLTAVQRMGFETVCAKLANRKVRGGFASA